MKPYTAVPYYIEYPGVHDAPVCKGVLNVPQHIMDAFRDRGFFSLASQPKMPKGPWNAQTLIDQPVAYIQYDYKLWSFHFQYRTVMHFMIFTDPKALRLFKSHIKNFLAPRKPRRRKDPRHFSFVS